MNFPFTTDQFLSVLEQYNETVWPAQVLLNLIGLLAIAMAVKKAAWSNRLISLILGLFWIWIGMVYHYGFFSRINPAAYVFAVLNVIQGILFLTYGVMSRRLSFQFRPGLSGITGAFVLVYAMIIYPLIGLNLGHVYPHAPTFGLPCPTTIFTFGILLWTDQRVPKVTLVIPLLWSIVGSMAALSLGISEDTGLLVSGIAGVAIILLRDRKAEIPSEEIRQTA